jgi:molecular chaperone GrpE
MGKMESVNDETRQPDTPELEAAPEEPAPILEEVAALIAERDKLAAEKAELYSQLLRRQADFENFRRRVERERGEFIQFAAMELVAEMLPILDDFERAVRAETADREYAKGVDLIYSRFFDTLKRLGLEPVETAGRQFDPNLHQAIDKVETTDAEDNSILQEYQRGYNFKGKLLRPSMVKVAVRP